MEHLLSMLEECTASPSYIHLSDYGDLAEGFINGWAWAQATAKECVALRKLPMLRKDYGPEKQCGSCRWFVQHYRYTGAYPWYTPVGCGHCTCPEKRRAPRHDPFYSGCACWEPPTPG